jgi:hypothetical protein
MTTTPGLYVIVVRDLAGKRVFGPYRSAAAASGAGLEAFGEKVFGNPSDWQVKPLEDLAGQR